VLVGKLNALLLVKETRNLPENVAFAIHASVLRTLLDAHSIDYQTAPFAKELSVADVADRARRFTAIVECWK
jgi:uncharacterized protein